MNVLSINIYHTYHSYFLPICAGNGKNSVSSPSVLIFACSCPVSIGQRTNGHEARILYSRLQACCWLLERKVNNLYGKLQAKTQPVSRGTLELVSVLAKNRGKKIKPLLFNSASNVEYPFNFFFYWLVLDVKKMNSLYLFLCSQGARCEHSHRSDMWIPNRDWRGMNRM